MEAKMILAKNLKRFRENNHLSQEKLAEKAGLCPKCYGNVERGAVHASLKTLDKLAAGTGMSLAALLQVEDQEEQA